MTAVCTTEPTIRSQLVNQTADWGVSLSEAASRKTMSTYMLAFGGLLGLTVGAMLVIPILAGAILFTASAGAFQELAVIAAILALAYYLNLKSKSGPKNALQIDYSASEVRLGSLNAAGVFVRHKVFPFRAIGDVSVDETHKASPAICLVVNGAVAKIHFTSDDVAHLKDFASRIAAAADTARSAPMRQRIQSRINGLEANVREVGQRVRSRVISRVV